MIVTIQFTFWQQGRLQQWVRRATPDGVAPRRPAPRTGGAGCRPTAGAPARRILDLATGLPASWEGGKVVITIRLA